MTKKLNEVLNKYEEFAEYINSINVDELAEEHSFEEFKAFYESLRRIQVKPVNDLVFNKLVSFKDAKMS